MRATEMVLSKEASLTPLVPIKKPAERRVPERLVSP
jgi:hypothetical protein